MNKLLTTIVAILAMAIGTASGHDYVPGKPQSQPILLKGGDLYTVSDGVLPQTDLLFEDGRITQIGTDIIAPEDAMVVDVTGQRVYPGLIDAGTTLGLIEIGEVRATNDMTERGSVTPEVTAATAYNPDSELLPTVRANGIATALVVPGGRLIRGRSSLMYLDGWTQEDMAVKRIAALHISWPSTRIREAWYIQESPEEQLENMAENRKQLADFFDAARAYMLAKEADPDIPVDMRLETMIPVLKGELPVIIHARDSRQIEQAVNFAQEQGVRMILAEAKEAYLQTDLLQKYDIPVILPSPYSMPNHQDDDYDAMFKQPRLLQEAGIRFCIASFASWGARNLPFQAGMAHAFGLPEEDALKTVTLAPAEILGVGDDLGSLAVGKRATIVVSSGDIMDHITHGVTYMWIDGAAVDLNNKHTELYHKYQQKVYPVGGD